MQSAGVSEGVARKIFENMDILESSHRDSFAAVKEIDQYFTSNLAKEIAHTIYNFESKFEVKLEYLHIASNKKITTLLPDIAKESHNDFKISLVGVTDLVQDVQVHPEIDQNKILRYTHTFGLAKKDN
jgi:hypothetical protein